VEDFQLHRPSRVRNQRCFCLRRGERPGTGSKRPAGKRTFPVLAERGRVHGCKIEVQLFITEKFHLQPYRVTVKVQKKEEKDEEDHVEVESLKGSLLAPGEWVPAGQVPHEILTAEPDALMLKGNLTLLFDFETKLSIISSVRKLATLEMISDLFCI
jgi:hypothetical protein